jgi:metal-dependent HD superfamily phosphatase/phosphodiesterase
MFRRYTFWVWLAVVFQLLNAAGHSLSFFITQVPTNETERQLLELMGNYQLDMGAGFHRTTHQLFTALSACFPLFYLLGALNNIYCLKTRVEPRVLRALLAIQVIVFGIAFGVIVVFAFLPPITLSGLVFLSLSVAFFLTPKTQ